MTNSALVLSGETDIDEIARLAGSALSTRTGLLMLRLTGNYEAYKCAVAMRMHELLADWHSQEPPSLTPFSMWLRDTLKHFGLSHDELTQGQEDTCRVLRRVQCAREEAVLNVPNRRKTHRQRAA